jgi:drug/metabolite transporter (DMT)-like permease
MSQAAEQRWKGIALAVAAALTWSAAGVGIKLLPLAPLAIAGFRSLFALPILTAALLLRGEEAHEPGLYAFALRQPSVWASAAAYALCVTLFVFATKLTTAANAILLQYSAPIYVALLSWPLLGERVRAIDWLAVLGCLLGVSWCFAGQLSASGWTGNLLALASGLCYGLLPLLWRRQLRGARRPEPGAAVDAGHSQRAYLAYLPQLSLVLGNALSVVLSLPWLLQGPPQRAVDWLIVMFLGSVQIGLAYLFYAAAVQRLRAVECLLAATLEPILNPLWVALWAHEQPGRGTLLGGSVILATVVVHSLLVNRTAPAVAAQPSSRRSSGPLR